MERMVNKKSIIKLGEKGDYQIFGDISQGNMKNYISLLYPGIYVVLADYVDVSSYEGVNTEEINYFGISYCLNGRYEWRYKNKRAYYFKNTLMINTVENDNEGVVFPMKTLKSITYFIELGALPRETVGFLKMMNLDIDKIYSQFRDREVIMIRDHPKVNQIYSRFEEDFYKKDLHQIKVLEILRFLQDDNPVNETSKYLTSMQVERINEIESYMRRNLDKKLIINDLSKKFEMSPTALKALFKEVYGQPIHSYLIDRKMEEGERLLRETKMSVAEIAARTGYITPGKFSTMFKKSYGHTPVEYRKYRRKDEYL